MPRIMNEADLKAQKQPTKSIKPKCKACNGTGKNSKGGYCAPCVANGRIG